MSTSLFTRRRDLHNTGINFAAATASAASPMSPVAGWVVCPTDTSALRLAVPVLARPTNAHQQRTEPDS